MENDSTRLYEFMALELIGNENRTSKAYAYERIVMSYIYDDDFAEAQRYMDSLRSCKEKIKGMSCAVYRLLSAGIAIRDGNGLAAKVHLDSLTVSKQDYALLSAQNRLYAEVYNILGRSKDAMICKTEWRKVESDRKRDLECFERSLSERRISKLNEKRERVKPLSQIFIVIVSLGIIGVLMFIISRIYARNRRLVSKYLESIEKKYCNTSEYKRVIEELKKEKTEVQCQIVSSAITRFCSLENVSDVQKKKFTIDILSQWKGDGYVKNGATAFDINEDKFLFCVLFAMGVSHRIMPSIFSKADSWPRVTLQRLRGENPSIIEDVRCYIFK